MSPKLEVPRYMEQVYGGGIRRLEGWRCILGKCQISPNNVFDRKRVYRWKMNKHGEIIRTKRHLVAWWYQEGEQVDYFGTSRFYNVGVQAAPTSRNQDQR